MEGYATVENVREWTPGNHLHPFCMSFEFFTMNLCYFNYQIKFTENQEEAPARSGKMQWSPVFLS